MKTHSILLTILSTFIITALLISSCNNQQVHNENNSQPKGFAEYMYFLQHYSHKLLLSIEAESVELADFYLHELEETTEDIIDHIGEYDGFAISELTETMLLPLIEDLEDELETGNWENIRQKAGVMIESCNACHMATDHGYIVIPDQAPGNPFLQSF